MTDAVPRFTCFDRAMLLTIGALLLAIAGVVLAGDRVGVTVAEGDFGPVGEAGGRAPVRVRFSEAMDPTSVAGRFSVEPGVPGAFDWPAPDELTFIPSVPWPADETVRVTIAAGARAADRDVALRTDLAWTFTVRPPRVTYLGPADAAVRDLYLLDLTRSEVEQLTATEHGVEDYAVSPTGDVIAFTRTNADGTADIWLRDLARGGTRPATACAGAVCRDPAWAPDGAMLAYQREELDGGEGRGLSAPRAWAVDVSTLEPRLLLGDAALLGADPAWSGDGRCVAVFDASARGVRVRDLVTGEDTVIPSEEGVSGTFSPEGCLLVYPVLARGAFGHQFYTQLEMVDLTTGAVTSLSGGEDAPVEDRGAAWSPDGARLLVARRYLDERFTPGQQIYLLDVETGEAEPLVVDARYNHAALSWDPSGERILFQRFALQEPDARPEIWMLDLSTNAVQRVAENAFSPAWTP